MVYVNVDPSIPLLFSDGPHFFLFPDVRGVMVEYLEVYSINANSNEVVSKTIIENG